MKIWGAHEILRRLVVQALVTQATFHHAIHHATAIVKPPSANTTPIISSLRLGHMPTKCGNRIYAHGNVAEP
jgi:hypothetical protein